MISIASSVILDFEWSKPHRPDKLINLHFNVLLITLIERARHLVRR